MSTAHSASDIRIVRKECRSAANAGFDTVVVIRGELPADCGKVRQVRAFAPAGGRLGRFVLGAARIYRLAMRERADIYHFHDPDLLPYGLVMRARGAKQREARVDRLPFQCRLAGACHANPACRLSRR